MDDLTVGSMTSQTFERVGVTSAKAVQPGLKFLPRNAVMLVALGHRHDADTGVLAVTIRHLSR